MDILWQREASGMRVSSVMHATTYLGASCHSVGGSPGDGTWLWELLIDQLMKVSYFSMCAIRGL